MDGQQQMQMQMQGQQHEQQQMMMQQQQQMMMQQQQMQGMQMMGQPQGGVGNYGFAAKPQVIKQKKYRDPYREYVKVAPQNLMYDRRIVRGNTFAALVIPVNMQPDPALIEKQKMEEAYMRQRQEEMRRRRQEENYRQQQMQESNQMNVQQQQMQSANQWEELSDHQNMVDEYDIEPDYYIDRPPDAILIPNSEGEAKTTQIFDGDEDLFDYENEVEPILQVLVGQSIEHARIEVIEQYENLELQKHKRRFLQIKEAELMETQRLEEARARKNDEIDRRNLQQRTAKNSLVQSEKKVVARSFAKDFLRFFKRDTMNVLVDLGALRRPDALSVGSVFVPQLYSQIKNDMQGHNDHQEQMDEILNDSMKKISRAHKQAMVTEINKRQEKKKELLRKKREEEEAQRKRKEKRAALRERHRLDLLKDQVQKEIRGQAQLEEYTTKLRVYDVKDPAAGNDGIIIIGGVIGELIITFTCLLDYILASPQNQSFLFTGEMVENYLYDLLCGEESQFPDNAIVLNLLKSLEDIAQGAGIELVGDQLSLACRDQSNMADFGLSFMFDIQKDLVLSADLIQVLYRAITKLATSEPAALQAVPEEREGMSEEEKEALPEQIEKVKADNEQIEKDNSRAAKMKTKISIGHKTTVSDDRESVCVRLMNHRTEVLGEDGRPINSARGEGEASGADAEAEPFNPERIPSKIPLVRPVIPETGLNTIVYHSEAQYALRKVLIEQARKNFKELEKTDVLQLLAHSNQRSRMLEDRFEEMLIRNMGFGRGCLHQDQNQRIIFKTFLQD